MAVAQSAHYAQMSLEEYFALVEQHPEKGGYTYELD